MAEKRQDGTSYFLDILKLFFALMIPFLHIGFAGGAKLGIIQEYIARLGVPFFFTVTGLLLEERLIADCSFRTVLHFVKRSAVILLIWAIIDLPLYYRLSIGELNAEYFTYFLKECFFDTPGYLWYIGALIIGEFIYGFLRVTLKLGRLWICIITGVLYVIGVFGNSWSVVWDIFPDWYDSFFLTTRNGLFFAAFMLCVGACLAGKDLKKLWLIIGLVISLVLFVLEVHFIHGRITQWLDTSLYFTIPLVSFFLVGLGKGIPVPASLQRLCRYARKWSVLIYCSQFAVMRPVYLLLNEKVNKHLCIAAEYFAMLVVSFLLLLLIEKIRSTRQERI